LGIAARHAQSRPERNGNSELAPSAIANPALLFFAAILRRYAPNARSGGRRCAVGLIFLRELEQA